MMNRFPWEFTAEEWLGPRILNRSSEMDREYAKSSRESCAAYYSTGGGREFFEEVWAEFRSEGVLIFDQERGGRVVGSFVFHDEWSIDPEYRGRGLATKVIAEYLSRFGKSPSKFLSERFNTITLEAEKLVFRVHSRTVQNAVARGVAVEQRVLDSILDVENRYAALRAGDDSALDLLPEQERQKKVRRRHKVRDRYHWVPVSRSVVDWVRGQGQGNAKRFEDMVVVVPG